MWSGVPAYHSQGNYFENVCVKECVGNVERSILVLLVLNLIRYTRATTIILNFLS